MLLTALPIARLAEQHLHPPQGAARLLTTVAVILASCSLLCLGLLVVVGTAQLPGNPLPDGWSDDEVREAVPHDAFAGKASILALVVVTAACGFTVHRHFRFRAGPTGRSADWGGPTTSPCCPTPSRTPTRSRFPGRVMVSTAMLACLEPAERRALFAHERAHLTGRHHRLLLATRLAGCVNPLLWPLLGALVYSTERWADEEAARVTGDRRLTARAVGKAALVARPVPGGAAFAAFATAGPVPRRVAALLGPVPPDRSWPRPSRRAGAAALVAAAGTTVSALSALNATVALFLVLEAATPL